MDAYVARPITYRGLRRHQGWALKEYAITLPGETFQETIFEEGIQLALGALPTPATREGRPGAGVIIAHQGKGADYVVLGWWDHENELPIRVFVRDQGWRPAAGESFCVWDLQVLWQERNLYVRTVLSGRPVRETIDEYLETPASFE